MSEKNDDEKVITIKHGVDTKSLSELFKMVATYISQPTVIQVAKGLSSEQTAPKVN